MPPESEREREGERWQRVKGPTRPGPKSMPLNAITTVMLQVVRQTDLKYPQDKERGIVRNCNMSKIKWIS